MNLEVWKFSSPPASSSDWKRWICSFLFGCQSFNLFSIKNCSTRSQFFFCWHRHKLLREDDGCYEGWGDRVRKLLISLLKIYILFLEFLMVKVCSCFRLFPGDELALRIVSHRHVLRRYKNHPLNRSRRVNTRLKLSMSYLDEKHEKKMNKK